MWQICFNIKLQSFFFPIENQSNQIYFEDFHSWRMRKFRLGEKANNPKIYRRLGSERNEWRRRSNSFPIEVGRVNISEASMDTYRDLKHHHQISYWFSQFFSLKLIISLIFHQLIYLIYIWCWKNCVNQLRLKNIFHLFFTQWLLVINP